MNEWAIDLNNKSLEEKRSYQVVEERVSCVCFVGEVVVWTEVGDFNVMGWMECK